MEARARAEFAKLTLLASTLDSMLLDLERQFADMASTLTLPPSEEDIRQANQILDNLTDYWKNLSNDIESATNQLQEDTVDLEERRGKATEILKELEERVDKSVKYATENLNISLGQLHPSPSQELLNKSGDGDLSGVSGPSGIPIPEAEATFLLPQKFRCQQMSPGDDNTDNTIAEYKQY